MNKFIKLNKKHLTELADIDYHSAHQIEGHRTLASYKKELVKRFNKKHELFFGYREEGILKAYITIKLFFPAHKRCEVHWLAVRKEFHQEGIGSKLMRHIELYAKKNGFRKVCLYTNKKKKLARRFYEKNGFKIVNEFPNYYGFKKNNAAVLFAKDIK